MSNKKNSPDKNKGSNNKNSSGKKTPDGFLGKVTKPLTNHKGAEQQKKNDKQTKQKKEPISTIKKVVNPFNWFSKSDKNTNTNVYTSVKSRHSSFSLKSSGASVRGSFKNDKYRFWVTWSIAGFLFITLVARAFYLQIFNADFYQEQGSKLITSQRTQPAYRGMIMDRNRQPLAISAPLASVYFSPRDYAQEYYRLKKELAKLDSSKEPNQEKRQRIEQALAEMDLSRLAVATSTDLNKLQQATNINNHLDFFNEKAVQEALPSGAGSSYMQLMNKITPEVAEKIKALDFVGVHEEISFQRYYPQPQPNANLLGFMGENSSVDNLYKGRAGIESKYDSYLAGQDGKVLVLKDARQNSLKEISQITPEVAGKDIQLTIDSRMQYLLYKELEKVGRKQKANWSSGIVVDVQTGEVLAMSTWPSFNPNNLSANDLSNQGNRPVQDVFEPGSVMKPFTVAAALASNKYNRHSLIDTSPGYIKVNGYTIRDHGNLGVIGFDTLLQKSSNVGTTKIALSLEPNEIGDMQKKFGFGSVTNMKLNSEANGLVPTLKLNENARRATVGYGYGMQATLAQLAQAYAILGAGGVKHPINIIKTEQLPASSQVIPREDAVSIVQMLEKVTQKGGTATAAAIDGYRVAGKTGTTRRNNPKGGYFRDQYRTIFVGLAPASNPRLVVAILVEAPQKQHYAGQVAAPVFRNVMKEALRLYNVPLDKPLKTR